jgi:RNA polymerase sigma-54 factor
MKNKNVQRPTLKLKFIPYLALRGKIFELNNLTLNDFINDFFETNPFVEFSGLYSYEDYIFNLADNEEDIYSFLDHQLNMTELGEEDKIIAQYIINNLNEEGYLKLSLCDIAKNFKVNVKKVEKILKLVQNLDPPGIAARDLAECFILQLERECVVSPRIKKVLKDHLKEIANGKCEQISKKYGLKIELLKDLKQKLAYLNPSPGLFLRESKHLVKIPDIIIERKGEDLSVLLNRSHRREFVINEKYREVLNSMEGEKKDEFELLLQKATWAQKAINQRDELLLKIGEKVLEANRSFFMGKGDFSERVLTGDFSDSPDLSETVISRIIQNKYIFTPRGIFPIHFFFKRKTVSFNTEEVKFRIKSLVGTEDKCNPLTDEQIMEELKKEGIQIKRRTVAKYRDMLNIPSVSKRHVDS